jgi:ABC-type transport system involved in multi-copper enzyme maturation permease subunit
MLAKLGLGPVFKSECLTTSRRRMNFVWRVLFIGFLLAALGMVAWSVENRPTRTVGIRQMAEIGEEFYLTIIGTQLALLILAAPAVAADAICLDRARGALVPLLTTDLSSSEIILGKLLARLLPTAGFVLCSLPVIAICFTMGGIHPEVVFGAYLVCFGVALVGATAALTLSVWCAKTYEILLVCYLLWIAYLLLLPTAWLLPASIPTGWIKFGNPYYLAFAPYMDPGSVDLPVFGWFFLGCAAASAVLLALAVYGLRRVVLRTAVLTRKRGARFAFRWPVGMPRFLQPSLDGNPVLWREWHRQRPSRWVRGVWILYGLGSLGFSLYAFKLAFESTTGFMEGFGILVNAFQVAIGLLLVSVTSVTSLQDERVRGSLDVILTTPMSTLAVFWGKWWGSYRVIFPLMVLPTFVASGRFTREFLFSGSDAAYGPAMYFLLMPVLIGCYGAGVVSIGLALATRIKGPGKAMAASVVIYVLITIGVLFAAVLISPSEEPYFAMGSSFLAAGFLSQECLELPYQRFEFVPVLMVWCVVYVVGAGWLALRTCRSFNRCLERMPEQMSRRFKLDRGAARVHLREQRASHVSGGRLVEVVE